MGLKKETMSPVRDIPVGYFNIQQITVDKGGMVGVHVGMWGSAEDRAAGKPPRDTHTFFKPELTEEAVKLIYAELMKDPFFEGAEAVFEPKAITVSHPGQLCVGDTVQLQYQITPEAFESSPVDWSSNDPDVASVDESGTLTAHAPGTITLQARIHGYSILTVVDIAIQPRVAPMTEVADDNPRTADSI